MEVSSSLAYALLLVVQTLPVVNGHGMMIEPAMRSSLWRFAYPGAEPNYNDNGLNCGGFMNQHDEQHGRCGICGDPYQGPRDNEAGGKYAKGIIARTYKAGQYITVMSDITANHNGYIELRLCPHNEFRVPVTQQCLNQYILKIKGHGTRYLLTSKKKGDLKIRHTVKLPDYVTCRQCVLQWYWKAGQHSGIDPITNKECIGCGKQESFVNCADIAITDEFGMFPSRNVAPPRQITTVPPYPMYDASFMFQGQGLFPEYYDEFNPFFTTPSYFSQYNYPFMDNGEVYGQHVMQSNFGSGSRQQNTRRRTHVQQNTGRRMDVQQNTGRRMDVQQNRVRINDIQRNTRPRFAANNNGDFRHMQQNIRRNNMNNRAIQRNVHQNTRTNRLNVRQNRQNNVGRNIDGVRGNLGQASRISSSLPSFKYSRPLISRNNRPHININNKVEPTTNPVRNDVSVLQINYQGSLTPAVVKTKAPVLDDSEHDDIMEDMLDSEEMFLTNSEFWNDFNRLLNISTPETKHALYEIADDADNLEELHQNIKLMLQMQGNSQFQQPSLSKDSESDESLDMDWLLAEAKDMELDSDEQNMLGLTKTTAPVKENDPKQEKRPDDHEMEVNDPYFNFQDENRIRDDTETDERYSDAFGDSSKEVHTPDDYYDLGPTSDAFDKDYDSSDGDTNNEIKTDDQNNKMIPTETSNTKTKQRKQWNNNKLNVQSNKDIWNENSLYKTDILDYDDKDVDVEGDAIDQQGISESGKDIYKSYNDDQTSERKPDKIIVNYFESDTHDYSDSETVEEGGNFKEHDKTWEDFTDEEDYKEEDGWSDEKRPDIESNTVIVTAKRNREDSGEGENNFETEAEAKNNLESNVEAKGMDTKFKDRKEIFEKNGADDTDIDNKEDSLENNGKENQIIDVEQSDKKEVEISGDVDTTGDKKIQNIKTDADDTSVNNSPVTKEDVLESMNKDKENNFKGKSGSKLDDIKEDATKLDDIKEAVPKLADIPKLDDIKEAVPKLDDMKEAVPKLDDIKEVVPKLDDIKEAKKNMLTSNARLSPIDDQTEPVKQDTLGVQGELGRHSTIRRQGTIGRQSAINRQGTVGRQGTIGRHNTLDIDQMRNLDDRSSIKENMKKFKSFPNSGVSSNVRNFPPTNDNAFGQFHNAGGAMISEPTAFSNMMSHSPVYGNYNSQNKQGISTFRKKIQDKISKSVSHRDITKNPISLSNILKHTIEKKELSPSLSKLVLKMFMNTKSTKSLCAKSLKPTCKPVSLWNKYQQIADWCNSLCPYGNCPTAVCKCTCESSLKESSLKICRAQTAFKEKAGELDQWCQKTCSSGDCPDLLCVCT